MYGIRLLLVQKIRNFEVKISEEFQNNVCCFCVPYEGDIKKANELANALYDDHCLFDPDYVGKRVRDHRRKKWNLYVNPYLFPPTLSQQLADSGDKDQIRW